MIGTMGRLHHDLVVFLHSQVSSTTETRARRVRRLGRSKPLISCLLLTCLLGGPAPLLAQTGPAEVGPQDRPADRPEHGPGSEPENRPGVSSASPSGNPDEAGEASTAAAPGAAPANAVTQPTWAGTVELVGFGPLRTTGTTTVRGFTADLDLSLGETLPLLEWATQIRASVEQERVGVLTDLSVVRLGKQLAATSPRGLFTGRAEVTAVQGLYDIALRYRLGARESAVGRPGQTTLIPYAGIRLVQADLGVSAQVDGPGGKRVFEREGRLARTWVQPLIGTQASVFLSPRLRAFARADLGGFDLAGQRDLSGNAQLGLGYALGNNTDLNLSWRYLGIAFDNGADRPNGYTTNQNGVEIGLKVFF
jgi:hypothetical protein